MLFRLFMFDYRGESWMVSRDVFLCHDETSKRDLSVRFLSLINGEALVVISKEPDQPFGGGSIRERIYPDEFGTRIINGRPLIGLLREKGLGGTWG
jgi:hypothetical protein